MNVKVHFKLMLLFLLITFFIVAASGHLSGSFCVYAAEEKKTNRPTVLLILDGFGLNDRSEHNAIALADTPVLDRLMKECPFVKGNASGEAVGLPEGQMGSSEVGHLNIGAGRIVYQDLARISKKIEDGDFFRAIRPEIEENNGISVLYGGHRRTILHHHRRHNELICHTLLI